MAQQIQYSYTPPPTELPLYEALFAAADKSQAGYITGHSAVEFLSLSKLPVDLLKTIWTMADSPPNNMLDKSKFYTAVRLIQLFQNGKRPMDGELRLREGEVCRPPYFEGVQFPNVQQQQQQVAQQQPGQQPQMGQPHQLQQQQDVMASPQRPNQQPVMSMTPQPMGSPHPQQQSLALTTSDPYIMTPAEQSRYSSLFPSYAQEGYVHGPQAVELFSKSGMDRDHLKTIWSMCDVPVDNKLDLTEFCVAMHLIVCVTKKGLACPDFLPGSLKGVLEGRDGQQQQQQGQMNGHMGGGQSVIGQPGQQPGQMGGGQSVIGQPGQQPSQMGMGQPGQMGHQQAIAPASPESIPSPDKMGMYAQQQGLPPPPVYGMQQQQHQMPQQQMMGRGMGYGQVNQAEQPVQTGAVGGETIDDAFAGLSNTPVGDVDEYSTIGGGNTVGGGMAMGGGMGMQQNAAASNAQSAYTKQMNPQVQQPQMSQPQMPQPVPTPSVQQNFVPASPKHVPKSHYEPASPAQAHTSRSVYGSPKPTKKDRQEDEEFNSELEKLRTAHQKLQAEVISLRAKANLVSDEEQEAQSEVRALAAGIAELSMELAGLKDEVAESKARLKDSLAMLKAQKEKRESLEAAVKETREIKDSLVAANEAVLEAQEAMLKENAHAMAASAKAAEDEADAPAAESDDLFSWDAAPAPVSTVMQTQSHSRGMSDISGGHWGGDDSSQVNRGVSDISHSYGHGWGENNSSVIGDHSAEQKKAEDAHSVHSVHTSHTANTGYQSAAYTANGGMQPAFGGHAGDQASVGGMQSASYGGYPSDQQSVGGNSAAHSAQFGGFPMGAAPTSAMVPAPSSGGYDYGMDFMGMGAMGAPIPEAQPTAFDAPAPAPVPPPNVPKSPTVAEVEAIKKEALNAERSYRQSKELVDTLLEQVQNMEMVAKQAEDNLHAAEKKKGSFTTKSKKKKEVAAAQEQAQAEREKVNEARQQLAAAKQQAESSRKLAEELRHKSEKAEMECVTAASMQQSNGFEQYGGLMGASNQGSYHNPFAMG